VGCKKLGSGRNVFLTDLYVLFKEGENFVLFFRKYRTGRASR
jgi:hypothetical protein